MVFADRLLTQPLLNRLLEAEPPVGDPGDDTPRPPVRTAPKVLVIDDDPCIRQLIELGLTRQGFSVSTAENGRVGLRMFEAQRPDLVITDILMPDMEGIETILALKAGATPPKVIAISGGGRLVGRDFLKWAAELGADEVLPKPFRMSALVALAGVLLGERPASQAAWPPVEPEPADTQPSVPPLSAAPQPDRKRLQCAYC